jgi:hypothetical protein
MFNHSGASACAAGVRAGLSRARLTATNAPRKCDFSALMVVDGRSARLDLSRCLRASDQTLAGNPDVRATPVSTSRCSQLLKSTTVSLKPSVSGLVPSGVGAFDPAEPASKGQIGGGGLFVCAPSLRGHSARSASREGFAGPSARPAPGADLCKGRDWGDRHHHDMPAMSHPDGRHTSPDPCAQHTDHARLSARDRTSPARSVVGQLAKPGGDQSLQAGFGGRAVLKLRRIERRLALCWPQRGVPGGALEPRHRQSGRMRHRGWLPYTNRSGTTAARAQREP